MKRWLMTFAFVVGCYVGYSLEGAPFLAAQNPTPNPFSSDEPSGEPPTGSSAVEPAAFDPQEELKKRQTMGDILELRQHFGSVVSQDDGQFAQLLGELVEHDSESAGTCSLNDEGPAAISLPKKSMKWLPEAASAPEQGGQNGNGRVALVPYQSPGPWQPGPVTRAQYLGPGPYSGVQPTYATPAQFSASTSGPHPAKRHQIRMAARQLDEVANNLEDLGEYESADRIRQQAQQLRQSCRE